MAREIAGILGHAPALQVAVIEGIHYGCASAGESEAGWLNERDGIKLHFVEQISQYYALVEWDAHKH